MIVDGVAGENALKTCVGQKLSWHWEVSIGFSAALWFIVCFKSALRLHCIPLCLLENHYSAIKSSVVSQANMEFSSVTDGCALPSCLLWLSIYTCDGQELQLSGKHSTDGSCRVMLHPFFGCSLTPELKISINAAVQLTSFK